jgi:hypothetical protein
MAFPAGAPSPDVLDVIGEAELAEAAGEHEVRSAGEHEVRSAGEHEVRSAGEPEVRSAGEHEVRSAGEPVSLHPAPAEAAPERALASLRLCGAHEAVA